MTARIYVDNAATTPVSKAALEAMLPHFSDTFGNPSAIYGAGLDAKKALEDARRKIARALGARVSEIFFTSGGTESDNWALCGVAEGLQGTGGKHVVTSAIEHSAVFHTAERLEARGFEVTYLPVDKNAQITPKQLTEAIRDDTVLVSIMLANNEVGTILPIKELCRAAKERNRRIVFHTDAVQAVGHIPLDVKDLGVDILSLSAHKFKGPKGVGAQYLKLATALPPFLTGGGQEKGRRSGTSNVPGAVGMAAALEEAVGGLDTAVPRIKGLRDRLIEGVLQIPGARLTGDPVDRLPGFASFVFDGLDRPPIVRGLDEFGICASSGSSCSAGSGDPSRVLLAAGYDKQLATASIRLTLGEDNTAEEVDYVIEKLSIVIDLLRAGKDAWPSWLEV